MNNELKEGKLNERPDFYRSLTQNPTIGRLRNINVSANLPYITEYLEGVAVLETLTLKYSKSYNKVPLVLGLIIRQELGETVCIPIYPDNIWMFCTISGVTIGKTGSNELAKGNSVKLRVYSLDLYE